MRNDYKIRPRQELKKGGMAKGKKGRAMSKGKR